MKNGLQLTMDKFQPLLPALRCPRCHGAFRAEGGSLVCENRHCYDAAKGGYVNLAGSRTAPGYDKALFEARRAVFAAGYYTPVLEAIEELLLAHVPGAEFILDAGCGEGYYTNALKARGKQENAKFFAADLCREAVRMGAKADDGIGYLVADLADLPFRDASLSAILDILSPANYAEFSRVLKGDGVIIKAVPGADYLREIRAALSHGLSKSEYSNEQVLARAEEKLRVLERREVRYTLPVPEVLRTPFFLMTPMSAHAEASAEQVAALCEITVHMEVFAAVPA